MRGWIGRQEYEEVGGWVVTIDSIRGSLLSYHETKWPRFE